MSKEKVLTIKQPYANLICSAIKDIEKVIVEDKPKSQGKKKIKV